MAAAGGMAVLVERVAYRPLRNSPTLVALISAIGVSFALQDVIRLVESLTTGQFYRVIPTFGNFDDRIPLFTSAHKVIDIQVKSVVVIVAAVVMLVGLNYLVQRHQGGQGHPGRVPGQEHRRPHGHRRQRHRSPSPSWWAAPWAAPPASCTR